MMLNLVAEYQGERLLHGYTYNPMNRLEKAWDERGRESCYHYNGLGQRIGRCADGIKEDCLLDVTKSYHNLLEYRKGEVKQNFYWDVTAAVLEEDGKSPRYYLNDELGSPLRVVYGTGKGDVYGYDEFGNDLSMTQTESEFGITYSRQGEAQPFGYTGYRYDEIAGTYFAQAREYVPGMGRFAAEDVIRGNGVVPKTLNRYGYVLNNPVCLVDLNGQEARGVVDRIIDVYADDEKAESLVEAYVYGTGENIVIENDDSWNSYMMENPTLTMKTGHYLAPIGDELEPNESKKVSITTAMIIDDVNNDHSGYMLLYGTNQDVGGYQINGIVSKDAEGTVTYDMTYTFNDVMDPNFNYKEDEVGYNILKFLKKSNDNITMKDYNISISWSDITVIYANGTQNQGWLAGMERVYVRKEIDDLNFALLTLPWYQRGMKPTMEEMIRYYTELQNYMNEHPEYYGCSSN